MTKLGDVPRAGDHLDWGGFRFEVMDMDDRRVDKVLVTPSRRKRKANLKTFSPQSRQGAQRKYYI